MVWKVLHKRLGKSGEMREKEEEGASPKDLCPFCSNQNIFTLKVKILNIQ